MKLSIKTQNKLKCIVGLCNHTYENKSCPWNKVVDAKDPRTSEYKILSKIIEEELSLNENKQKKSIHK